MASPADPTEDPEFQKVIRHFVTTPPKPHSEIKVGKRKASAKARRLGKKRMIKNANND
jgi:hypothetical protein